jgi:hypothetical protein
MPSKSLHWPPRFLRELKSKFRRDGKDGKASQSQSKAATALDPSSVYFPSAFSPTSTETPLSSAVISNPLPECAVSPRAHPGDHGEIDGQGYQLPPPQQVLCPTTNSESSGSIRVEPPGDSHGRAEGACMTQTSLPTTPEPYKHSPLEGDGWIRCILLHCAASTSDIIAFKLFHIELKELGAYAAISYTWDNQPYDRMALCNGKPFYITKNCHDILFRLRGVKEDSYHLLWIDQICIDQQSDIDRTLNVLQMGLIYQNALFVITWLGHIDHETEECLCNTVSSSDVISSVGFSSLMAWLERTQQGLVQRDRIHSEPSREEWST